MASPSAISFDTFYHIYNRGINRGDIFIEKRNYKHFMALYTRYIEPVAETYAYCLLKNHFHILVRIRSENDIKTPHIDSPSRSFSNFFNAYAKAINKAYQRTGSLFQHPFGRVVVTTKAYFIRLVVYIHQNPQKHNFVPDFRDWKYSSFGVHLSGNTTHLERGTVLDWFGGAQGYIAMHAEIIDNRDQTLKVFVPHDE